MSLKEIIENAPKDIQAKFSVHHHKKGSHILYAGEENDYLFFLMKGEAEVYTLTQEGVMLSLNSYRATSFFGEYEVFDSNSTTASILAKTPCKVISIHRNDLFKWMKQDFNLTAAILQHFASDVVNSHKTNARLAHMTIKERILISVHSHYAIGNLNALSKQILIQESYAPIRSVNRAIAALKADGIIDYRNKRFTVINEALLKREIKEISDL